MWRSLPMGPLGRDEGAPVAQGDAQLVLFEGIAIRKIFHENQWHFAVVDIIAALTGTERPRKYWSDLKAKLIKDEGFTELSDKIGQLKMQATDGKFYLTDTVTVETVFRIIQSIPSRKAEPFAGFHENANAAHAGGRVAGDARRNLERQLKRSVVSRANFLENSRKNDPEKLTQPPSSSQKR